MKMQSGNFHVPGVIQGMLPGKRSHPSGTNLKRMAQFIKPEANVNDERLLCKTALNTSHYMMQTTLCSCSNIMLLSFL